MKTKYIFSIVALALGLTACENYFDNKYLDNGDPYIKVVKTYDYTLTTADYATIANNATNKAIAYEMDSLKGLKNRYQNALANVGKLGIIPTLVSRTPKEGMLGYDQLTKEVMAEHTIIVNCTPLGMFPEEDACPAIPYELITARHLLFDCIYNPAETLFLQQGKAQGATIQNGLEMLYGQAKAAWKIWNSDNDKHRLNIG